jgi:preprotein translocase subunit SecG
MNVLIGILTGIHVLVAMALVGLVLMQKSQDQGVGAAFGGGVTETVFGAGTTTALVRMTIWCACIMLGTTLLLAVLHSRRGGGHESLMQKAVQSAPAAPASAAPQTPSIPVEAPASTPSAPISAAPASAPEKPAETKP